MGSTIIKVEINKYKNEIIYLNKNSSTKRKFKLFIFKIYQDITFLIISLKIY
jgi:hypothetical protein